MNRFVRRGFLGAFAGATAGASMLFFSANGGVDFAMAIAAGLLYGACVPPVRGAYADNVMAAALMGIPLWGIANVIFLPWFLRGHIAWSAAGMESHFWLLVTWVLFGVFLGAILQVASDVAGRAFGPEVTPIALPSANPIRIVILGGGFGGMKTAECLEREFPGSRRGLDFTGGRSWPAVRPENGRPGTAPPAPHRNSSPGSLVFRDEHGHDHSSSSEIDGA